MMNRKDVLLRACFDLLQKQAESPYVLNLLDETVHYDDSDCDGSVLMEDIAVELDIDDYVS